MVFYLNSLIVEHWISIAPFHLYPRFIQITSNNCYSQALYPEVSSNAFYSSITKTIPARKLVTIFSLVKILKIPISHSKLCDLYLLDLLLKLRPSYCLFIVESCWDMVLRTRHALQLDAHFWCFVSTCRQSANASKSK